MVKWKLQVVLTKCDLVERFELARRIQVIKQKVSRPQFYDLPYVIIFVLNMIGCDRFYRHVFYFFIRCMISEILSNELFERFNPR